MRRFRSKDTVQAVQWYPGLDVGGVLDRNDPDAFLDEIEMSKECGFLPGSIVHCIGTVVWPSDWIVILQDRKVVMSDEEFKQKYDPCS